MTSHFKFLTAAGAAVVFAMASPAKASGIYDINYSGADNPVALNAFLAQELRNGVVVNVYHQPHCGFCLYLSQQLIDAQKQARFKTVGIDRMQYPVIWDALELPPKVARGTPVTHVYAYGVQARQERIPGDKGRDLFTMSGPWSSVKSITDFLIGSMKAPAIQALPQPRP